MNYLAAAVIVGSGVTLVALGVASLRGHRIGVAEDENLIETLRTGADLDVATEPLLPLLAAWRDEVEQS